MSITDLFTSLDTENIGEKHEHGLQPWRIPQRLLECRTYATTTRENGRFISAGKIKPTRDELAHLLETLRANNRIIVGWNLAYDIAVFLAYGLKAEVFGLQYLDAQLLWKRLDPHRHSFSLKDWLRINVPQLDGYEIDFAGYFDPDKPTPSDDELLTYNKLDTTGTLVAALNMWAQLDPMQQRSSLIEGKNLRHKADMNLRGLPVDLQSTQIYYRMLVDTAEKAMAELLPHIQPVTNTKGVVQQLNFGSVAHLRQILYDQWQLQPPHNTDTGAPSTDKAALKLLALDDPRALLLLQCRESKNSIKKYVSNVVDSATYHGPHHLVYGSNVYHTRPNYITAATYTGRGTYSSKQGKKKADVRQTGIAGHQWKRAKECRRIICAPPGYKMCEFDAAGQEVRWMAEMSRDPVMLDIFRPGAEKDPHSTMGARLSGYTYERFMDIYTAEAGDEEYDIVKQKRYLGKFTNLSSQYRIGVRKMRLQALAEYDLVLSWAETQHLQDTYKNTYAGVVAYWENQILLAKEQGYIATLGGRRVEFNAQSWTKEKLWESGSTAINLPIQGTAADEAELALYMTSDYILNNGGMLAFLLHDAIFVFFPESTAEQNCRDMLKILNNLPYEQMWGYKPVIAHPFDAQMGDNWGDMHKVTA